MKIIFSRKGFDSAAGGVASPIFPSGHLLSLPIPEASSPICYRDVQIAVPDALARGCTNLAAVVRDLSGGSIEPHHGVHLDPDLHEASLHRAPGWRPLFGQAGAAQGHLRRQGVGVGDLFLFYGWFRRVQWQDGQLRPAPHAPDLHVLYGWMQVGGTCSADAADDVPPWATYHSHCQPEITRSGENVLYWASQRLHINGRPWELPGAGIFPRFRPELQLTAPGASRSVWQLPHWFLRDDSPPSLSYHTNRTRWTRGEQAALLRTVGRGQEFVFDSGLSPLVPGWLSRLFGLE